MRNLFVRSPVFHWSHLTWANLAIQFTEQRAVDLDQNFDVKIRQLAL